MPVENYPQLLPPSVFIGLNTATAARCANAVLEKQSIDALDVVGIAATKWGQLDVYVVHRDWMCAASETGTFKKRIEVGTPQPLSGVVAVRVQENGGTPLEDISFTVEGVDAGGERVGVTFSTGARTRDYVDPPILKQIDHLRSLMSAAVGL
jgi:hypothetical protein